MIEVYTVSQVATYVRELLETDVHLSDLWVEGEVSNLTRSAAGHTYFTLKDESAQLRCVMFRRQYAGTPVEDGMQVMAHGRMSFFERRGELQLNVDFVQPAGVGIWQAQLERLKAQLEEEGLFEPSRKRPLPSFPRRIGVVTSPTGAVFHDICTIVGRRWPLTEIVLAPTPVQGDEAAPAIVEALSRLNHEPDIDVIIVARGGGSVEELWPFNEEIVARAIYASRVPVVSAVGHETDYTIADYVADLRAPTPSAAAELVVPDRKGVSHRIMVSMVTMEGWVAGQVTRHRAAVEQLTLRLRRSVPDIGHERQRLVVLVHSAHSAMAQALNGRRQRLQAYALQLGSLEPRSTLARGYALVQRQADGQMVRSVSQVKGRDRLEVQVADGSFPAEVSRQYGF
ncbi:MAG: exodeoxyribonuclease VII large subunit [Dehalococcoidia bacterium]